MALPLAIWLAAAACGTGAASHAAGTGAAPAAAQHEPEFDAPRELTADQQVLHALQRLTFGPRPGDAARVRAMGVDRWIEAQLDPARIDDRATEARLASFATLQRSGTELLRAHPPAGQVVAQLARERGVSLGAAGAMPPDSLRARIQLSRDDSLRVRAAARAAQRVGTELQTAKLLRAVSSERQLDEVMVDFWENHFSVFAGKGRVRYYLPEYDAAIRAHSLGRFRDLLGAVAKSPAMLQYLDNFQSVADSGRATLAGGRDARLRRLPPARRAAVEARLARLPQRRRGLNENYARELLELHTLGVDGGYTQQDVIEVARALTGWSLRPGAQGGGFAFQPAVHDAGEKLVLGQRLPAGRGIEDGEAVLDLLARHPSTARFIATKLARRFVSDTPPAALVERAAATFTRTDGDIRATVRTIVRSPEFFAADAWRAKVKSPLELVASTLRAMGAAPDTTPFTALVVARLGQPTFGRQSPDGWPETGEAWMNTGAILERINFGLAVAAGRLPGTRVSTWPEAARLGGAPRAEQVDGVVAALLGGAVSPDTRAVLVSGDHPLLGAAERRGDAPTDATRDDTEDDADGEMRAEMRAPLGPRAMRQARRGTLAQLPPLTGLAQVVGLALGSPEFQRR